MWPVARSLARSLVLSLTASGAKAERRDFNVKDSQEEADLCVVIDGSLRQLPQSVIQRHNLEASPSIDALSCSAVPMDIGGGAPSPPSSSSPGQQDDQEVGIDGLEGLSVAEAAAIDAACAQSALDRKRLLRKKKRRLRRLRSWRSTRLLR